MNKNPDSCSLRHWKTIQRFIYASYLFLHQQCLPPQELGASFKTAGTFRISFSNLKILFPYLLWKRSNKVLNRKKHVQIGHHFCCTNFFHYTLLMSHFLQAIVQAFAIRNESPYNSERSEIFRDIQNKMLKILFISITREKRSKLEVL